METIRNHPIPTFRKFAEEFIEMKRKNGIDRENFKNKFDGILFGLFGVANVLVVPSVYNSNSSSDYLMHATMGLACFVYSRNQFNKVKRRSERGEYNFSSMPDMIHNKRLERSIEI